MGSDVIGGAQFGLQDMPDTKSRVLGNLQKVAAGKSVGAHKVAKEDENLRSACRQFEAVLVAQMLKEMRATVPKTDLFGSQEKEDMFRGMLDDETAKSISQTSAFGLADVIYSQLSQQNTAKVVAQPVDKSNGKVTNK